MGIADDLAPYMTLLRFNDASDIESAYYEAIHDNILEGSPSGDPAPVVYATTNPDNGIFREMGFGEASTVTSLTAFFEPVADGEMWRAVVRTTTGKVIGYSDWVGVSGRAGHEFEFSVPAEIEANRLYVFGVEPQDPNQQATAYYNDFPLWVDGAPTLGRKTLLSMSNPPSSTWDNQVLIAGYADNFTIRRIDTETGGTVMWTYTGTGRTISIGLSPNDEALVTDGTKVLLLDIADGSEVWQGTLNDVAIDWTQVADKSVAYILLANGQVAVVSMGATPSVTHYATISTGYYSLTSNTNKDSISVSPDGTRVVVMKYSPGQIACYDPSDFSAPVWEYFANPSTVFYSLACNDVAVYTSGNNSSEYFIRLDIVNGIETYVGSGWGSQAYELWVDPSDKFILGTSTTWFRRLDIDPNSKEPSDTDMNFSWSYQANVEEAAYIACDGRYAYMSVGEDRTHIYKFNVDDGTQIWQSPSHVSQGNTFLNTPTLALDFVASYSVFEDVETDTPLALRIVRQIDWDPIDGQGQLTGHRRWQTIIDLSPVSQSVRALVADVMVAQGNRNQIIAQARPDSDLEWVPLTLARRSLLASDQQFAPRLILRPGDVLEDWKVSASARGLVTNEDNLSYPSETRMRSNIPSDSSYVAFQGPGTHGHYFWTTHSSYDHDDYGVMFEGDGPDGDVEFIAYFTQSYNYFFFRSLDADPDSGLYLRMYHAGNWILYDNGSQVVGDIPTPGSGDRRFRIVWKGSNLAIFVNGRIHYTYGSLPYVGAADRNWFGVNTYYNIDRFYALHGRGMSAGPGAHKPKLESFSMFHERVS